MRKDNPFVLMAIASALAARFIAPAQRRAERRARAGHRAGRNAGWSASGCGIKECERRRRQIDKGMLTESNGLVRR